jgi:hypothetical protein
VKEDVLCRINKIKFSINDLYMPIIFENVKDAHNYIIQYINEQDSEERYIITKDINEIPEQGKELWMEYYVYTESFAIWISSTEYKYDDH